jgi:hypothetical protein
VPEPPGHWEPWPIRDIKTERDGVYDVTNEQLSAGFAIWQGRLVWCAPILRKRFDYWARQAQWVGEVPDALKRER